MNAAVWLGTTLFFTFGAEPACFSADMRARVGIPLGTFHPGAIAGVITSRYYHVVLACAVVAVLHFLAEWFYMGRPRRKFSIGLVVGLLVLTFIGRNAIQPSLEGFNRTHYSPTVQPADRESAGKSFRILHVLGIALNIITIGGLVVYMWRVSSPSDTLRFVRPVQFGR
jgi:hypothetical protein